MSKKNENDPVPEKLCVARMQTIREEINGLKKTIYVSSSAVALVIVVVQFLLTFFR